MKIRNLTSVFFLLYGLFIPIGATEFMEVNLIATIAMIGSCFVIAMLLLLRRAFFLNIMIAFMVFKAYLIRPYVDIFLPKLNEKQFDLINGSNSFFNPSDAAIVYLGLFSILVAWLLGLLISQPIYPRLSSIPPWIFRQVDRIVTTMNWRFFLTLALLGFYNFRTPAESYQGLVTGDGVVSAAYGVTSIEMISIVCLFVFLAYRNSNHKQTFLILLAPALYLTAYGAMHGSRGALYNYIVYASIFVLYYNFDKRINIGKLKIVLPLIMVASIAILLAIFAQSIKPLLKSGIQISQIWDIAINYTEYINADNIYYSLTRLMHRVSSLQPQFLILNDHYIHNPWEFFNPVASLMRTVNDLVPGSVFPDMLTINQLFNYIYFDDYVNYSSHMWSIQGVLYIYFGLWISPLVIFLFAYLIGMYSIKLDRLVRSSPSFMVFTMLLFMIIVENATIERVVPVHIVKPIVSFVVIIFMYKLLYILFPTVGKTKLDKHKI